MDLSRQRWLLSNEDALLHGSHFSPLFAKATTGLLYVVVIRARPWVIDTPCQHEVEEAVRIRRYFGQRSSVDGCNQNVGGFFERLEFQHEMRTSNFDFCDPPKHI